MGDPFMGDMRAHLDQLTKPYVLQRCPRSRERGLQRVRRRKIWRTRGDTRRGERFGGLFACHGRPLPFALFVSCRCRICGGNRRLYRPARWIIRRRGTCLSSFGRHFVRRRDESGTIDSCRNGMKQLLLLFCVDIRFHNCHDNMGEITRLREITRGEPTSRQTDLRTCCFFGRGG